MKQYKHAFVIGRFLPPHIGHLSMIQFAGSVAERVTVLVEQDAGEQIPVDLRVQWLHESLSNRYNIVPLYGHHPARPPEDAEGANRFWMYWKHLIQTHAPNIDVVVTSDDYGQRLAQDQNVPWLPFDRLTFPISATLVKERPWDRFSWLIPAAQQNLLRRLVVLGAESTGKSVMCKQLARTSSTPTVFVPEYAEHWIKRQPDQDITEDVLKTFLSGHTASRNGLRAVANKWMCEDSHALTTAVWALYMGYNDLANDILAVAQQDVPHHVIVPSINGAVWIADIHRKEKSDLAFFENTFLNILNEWKWDYTIVQGDWDVRNRQAIAVRERFLHQWQTASWSQWTTHKTSDIQ